MELEDACTHMNCILHSSWGEKYHSRLQDDIETATYGLGSELDAKLRRVYFTPDHIRVNSSFRMCIPHYREFAASKLLEKLEKYGV